jgi:hypothetical protein
MFIFYPVTAYSQASLYPLSTADTSIGLALSKQDIGITKPKDTTTIGANLDYGIQDDLKVSFQVSIGLTDPTNVPPAPIGQIGIVQVKPLGDTGLQYFWSADLDAAFFRIVQEPTNQVLERSRLIGLSGAVGVLKRLETESGQVINPFFALSYTKFWENLETNVEFDEALEDLVFKQTKDSGDFGGEIGVEIELSPTMTALGGFRFSFENSDVAFRVGLNFY